MNQTAAWAGLQPGIVTDISGNGAERSELEVPP